MRNARLLFEEYRRVAGDDLVPTKRDIDPAKLKPILQDMLIYERLADDEQWRIRLMGTRVAERLGKDFTGANPLSIISPAHKQNVQQAFLRVLSEPCGNLVQVEDQYSGGKTSSVEVLRLPLIGASGQIDTIVSVTQEIGSRHDRPWDREEPILMAKPLEVMFFDLRADALPF